MPHKSHLYIFCQSDELRASLSRLVRLYLVLEKKLPINFDPKTHSFTIGDVKDIYEVLDNMPPIKLKDTVVIFSIKEAGIEKFKTPLSTETRIARLLLRYPEVYWIFGAPKNSYKSIGFSVDCHFVDLSDIDRLIPLLENHTKGYRTLFDPSGFRAWLKHNIKTNLDGKKRPFSLPPLSASIDEEHAYAYLHAYIAYRMGYRCYPVTTLEIFKTLNDTAKKIDLLFDDIFINFPDRGDKTHLSDLKKRDSLYSTYSTAEKRVFVTVGHKNIKWADETYNYLKYLRGQGRAEVVYKPSGGIYNLLKEAKLLKDYKRKQKEKMQYAKTPHNIPEPKDGHSAPGVLLETADALIERAERIYSSALTVEDCIHGALLVTEATDLLNYKTPTTALEAIALRHKLEVKAECMFYGMQYSIEVKERLKELKEEVHVLSKWVHPRARNTAFLNAKITILTEIARLFREKGQFDEEQECLRRLRKLHRDWFFLNHRGLIFLKPLRAYFEILLGRLSYFLLAIILWPLFFGILDYFFSKGRSGILLHLRDAFKTFFKIHTVVPESVLTTPVNVTLQIGSYVHLGIFIAFLFHIIQRRT
jgi:hypothetical protein